MDENEYRNVYNAVNSMRCPFEKALLSRRHQCDCLVRYNIAEREAVGCTQKDDWQRCQQLLLLLKEKANFALRATNTTRAMGHAKEIKVQSGGLIGLNHLLDEPQPERAINIKPLIDTLLNQFGSLEQIPYSQVVPAIASFEGRRKSSRK